MASTKSKLIKKSTRSDLITYAMVLVVFAVVEILKSTGNISSLLRGLLVPLCMYSILAVSLNLVVGYLGELSLGHAGFMCVGAYASSIFSVVTQNTLTNAWIRFPLAILVGGLCAAIFGVLIGIPVLRLKGDYLAIVTLAFGEIIKNILGTIYVGYDSHGIHASFTSQSSLNLEANGTVLINGPLGITGTPNDSTFVIGIVLLLITLFVILNFIHSRAGRAVMSLLAATSKNFGYNMSIMILVFVVLGGIGNIRGSIIAACVLTALPEVLRGLRDYRMLIYAVVLIVMMIMTSSPKAIAFWETHSIKKFFKKGNGKTKKEAR